MTPCHLIMIDSFPNQQEFREVEPKNMRVSERERETNTQAHPQGPNTLDAARWEHWQREDVTVSDKVYKNSIKKTKC